MNDFLVLPMTCDVWHGCGSLPKLGPWPGQIIGKPITLSMSMHNPSPPNFNVAKSYIIARKVFGKEVKLLFDQCCDF